MSRTRPFLAFVAGCVTVAATTSVASGLAHAGTSARASAVIHACVATQGGAVRIPLAGSCREGERHVAWAQKGPRGARGPAGTTGATLVTGTLVAVAPGAAEEADVTCPMGTKVIGTGVRNTTSNNAIDTGVYVNDIDISDDRTSVAVFARNSATAPSAIVSQIAAQAVCAR